MTSMYTGLPVEEAVIKAKQAGYTPVVVEIAQVVPLMNDYRKDRITFVVRSGRVVSVRTG